MAQVTQLRTEEKGEQTSRLLIILSKGTMDMVYPALMIATTGATMGKEVHMFFTVKHYMKRSFAMIYWRAFNGSLERIFDLFFGKTRFPISEQAEPEKPVIVVKAPEGGRTNA